MPSAGNESGFIAAIHMNGDWNADSTSSTTSAKPNVFTDGVNSISINPEVDNARLSPANCNNFTDVTTLRALLNTSSNWETDNSTGYPHIPPACNFISTLSVDDNQINETTIAVYPNPVKNTLNIRMPLHITTSNLNIFDINGKQVQSIKDHLNAIDVTVLERGMYFVEITANDKTYVKKIVKN